MTESTIIYGVTGATGKLGSIAVIELLKTVKPEQIVAIVRDRTKAQQLEASGVTVRVATYQDKDSLQEALKGIDKLLLVSSSDMSTSRSEQHANVIDAAKANGVQRIAYTSGLKADTAQNPLMEDHILTEEYLKNSGVAYSVLRHGWYTENYLQTIEAAKASGVVLTSAGSGKVSSATRAEYAAADVAALINDDGNQVHELAGDQAWNFEELATVVGTIVGKEVALAQVNRDEHVKALVEAGVPEQFAQLTAAIDASIAAGDLEEHGGELSRLIGHKTNVLSNTLPAAS